MTCSDLHSFRDDHLVERLRELVVRDHRYTAELLRTLDEVDRRKLWARLGHPSMFDFCVARFHMSESTAGKRIGAARTARRFPVIFDMVARGEIHLSGIHRLKTHLTDANHRQVLAEATHKTIKEIEHLVARLAPQADARSSLRALPNLPGAGHRPRGPEAAPPAHAGATDPQGAHRLDPAAGPVSPATRPDGAGPTDASGAEGLGRCEPNGPNPRGRYPAPRRMDPTPLSPKRYKLTVTLDEETHAHLEQLQDLLAHQVPNGDPAAIVSRALALLLEQTLKHKAAVTDRPRPAERRSRSRSRSIPAAIRREVWERDRGRCGFIGEDGKVCGETRAVEFAHLHPWARGGEHSVENLGLRCRAHNAYEAERDYGEAFMARRQEGKSSLREEVARYGSPGEPGVAIRLLSARAPAGVGSPLTTSADDRASLAGSSCGSGPGHVAHGCHSSTSRQRSWTAVPSSTCHGPADNPDAPSPTRERHRPSPPSVDGDVAGLDLGSPPPPLPSTRGSTGPGAAPQTGERQRAVAPSGTSPRHRLPPGLLDLAAIPASLLRQPNPAADSASPHLLTPPEAPRQ